MLIVRESEKVGERSIFSQVATGSIYEKALNFSSKEFYQVLTLLDVLTISVSNIDESFYHEEGIVYII